jgi:hypothetical protein
MELENVEGTASEESSHEVLERESESETSVLRVVLIITAQRMLSFGNL